MCFRELVRSHQYFVFVAKKLIPNLKLETSFEWRSSSMRSISTYTLLTAHRIHIQYNTIQRREHPWTKCAPFWSHHFTQHTTAALCQALWSNWDKSRSKIFEGWDKISRSLAGRWQALNDTNKYTTMSAGKRAIQSTTHHRMNKYDVSVPLAHFIYIIWSAGWIAKRKFTRETNKE